MPGWLADFFRFFWGLFYWNTRKTLFRWRGGHCPCQNPSDSGRALETTCDACLHWHQPARFRRVCPLLVITPNGLRCSVNTKDVRPFWGRAVGFYSGTLGASCLAAVLGVFVLLRGIGYPVRFVAVAWPPAWSEIRIARGEYFFQKARRALAANRPKEAGLALRNAYECNPHDYRAGLMLAKLFQVGQPAQADFVYAHLLHDDIAQSALIAEQWYRGLLAHGDFQEIAQVVPVLLVHDAAHAQVWMHAMFFATRCLGDTRPLLQMLAQDYPLAPGLRHLVEIELLIETGRTNEAHEALRALHVDRSYIAYYQASELTALGFPDEALAAINNNAGFLPSQDVSALRLDAFGAEGWMSLVRNEVELVLSAPSSTASVELLCAHFIRHPDPKSFAELFEKLRREPLPQTTATYEATVALFCAAGVNGDGPNLLIARNALRQLGLPSFNDLDQAEAFFRGQSDQQRLGNILPMFQPPPFEIAYATAKDSLSSPVMLQPLALDVTYALFEHYRDKPVAAPQ
jgi:tetratricopeptide (TPR) repeat protein